MEFEQFLRDYAIYISVGVFVIIALFLLFYLSHLILEICYYFFCVRRRIISNSITVDSN